MRVRILVVLLLLVTLVLVSSRLVLTPGVTHAACTAVWTQNAGNPIIRYGQASSGMAWNDPTVIKLGNSSYRMWLSGGILDSTNPVVRVYMASSSDGVNWNISPTPMVQPGPAGSWDDHRIETPSVIKVGSTYHMYYSGCNLNGCVVAQYSIGHATSTDGTNWVKDPRNPLITATADASHWGYYCVAEPAAVYEASTGKILLYYVSEMARVGYTGGLGVMQGILRASSTNGSAFFHYDANGDGYDDAVLTQSAAYPASNNYVGYSAPNTLIDSSHVYHLFYDVAQFPTPGDWRQVALAHATSTDGIHFTETETNIYTYGGTGLNSWFSWEVRSPAVIQDGSSLKMWFAGETGTNDWSTAAIGLSVYGCK